MGLSSIQKLFTENAPDSDVIIEKALELGRDFLGDEWKKVEKSQVNVRQITNAQSNDIFLATSPVAKPFLIRIHRQSMEQKFQDTVICAIFSERGLGPKLYGFFDGGRLEEFYECRTFDVDGVLDPEISRRVGSVLPKYHTIEMPLSKKNQRAIPRMREWLNNYKALGGGDWTIKKTTVTYSEHPEKVSVEDLSRELDTFEKWAGLLEDTVVFCHNDLAGGNVLELSGSKEMVLIDWEFSSYNWRGFDAAMHLAETAIDYRVPVAPWVSFSEPLTDSPPNLDLFAEAYLAADAKIHDYTPSDALLERLRDEILFFWPLTHLYWAIGAMGALLRNDKSDFDLSVAANDRLAIYFHMKPQCERIFEKLSKK